MFSGCNRRHSARCHSTVRSPVALIDQDIRGLVGTILADLDIVQIDAAFLKAGELNTAPLVVAERADVLHAESQLRARHQRAGHLAARAQDLALERDFARIRRKVRQQDQSIGGIQADADNVEWGSGRQEERSAYFFWGGIS